MSGGAVVGAGIDESRLRHAFLEESEELLQKLGDSLQGLEARSEDRELVNEAFRTIHSLKSESALMGYNVFSELAHRMEDVLGAVRDGTLTLDRPVLDRVFKGSDIIAEMLAAIGRGGSDTGFDTRSILAELASARGGPSGQAAPAASPAAPADAGAPSASPAVAPAARPVFGDEELRQIAEARDRGETLYRLTLTVDEAEPMKFARAYLVFTNLEVSANVISSFPPMNGEIAEDSLYGRTVIYLTTRQPERRIREAVGVDQIRRLDLERLDFSAVLDGARPGAVDPGMQTGAAAAAAPPSAAPGTPSASPAAAAEGASAASPSTAAGGASTPEGAAALGGLAGSASAAAPAAQGAGEAGPLPPTGEKTTIRVDTRKLDDLWSSIAELFLEKSRISRVYERVSRGERGDEVREELGEAFDSLEKISTNMQQSMMATRMVPISVIFSKLPRLVRDLSRKLGKTVALAISGEETEIDRAIVEALSDPLTHIIRNSLDHGIEYPEERVRMGKPEKGKVRISAFQQGGNIVIELEDDGKGVDIARVRDKAMRAGIPGAEQMTDLQLMDLIFLPGFSTREVVTDLSGRGVGMDVVATRIRGELKGDVKVLSQPGEGTLITLTLPLTLTIVNALLVRSDSQTYAIPIAGVDSTAKILNTEIRGEEGKWTCAWMGEEIPLYYLGSLRGHRLRSREEYFAVILQYGLERGCLVVDELLEEQEVVIKPIDDLLNYGGLFSGCSVLEDGTLVFILDSSFVQGGIL